MAKKQKGFRLLDTLLERVEAFRQAKQAEQGMIINTTDAVQILLTTALDAIEAKRLAIQETSDRRNQGDK
jgi:hypothetical protein